MRIGASYFPVVGRVAQIARQAEATGLDDISFGDTPLLAGELYASLMEAVTSTTTIELVAGVTNSVTRDPAVTASGMATLQLASRGRIVCGLGRGDSAVLKIGKRPDRLADFEWYVRTVRAYLEGEVVDRDGTPSRIDWVAEADVPAVPIEIVATGAKVLAIAARHADRIGLGVGANPDFVARAVERARAAVKEAGRDPDSVEIGLYVPGVLSHDRSVAVSHARYIAAKFANFNALAARGRGDSQLPDVLANAVETMRRHYRYEGDPGHAAAAMLDAEFVEWMAVTGSPDAALHRLEQLREAGADYVRLMSGFHQLPADVAEEHLAILAAIVPGIRDTNRSREKRNST